MSLPPFHTPDISLPQNYWSVLSQDDKDEFMRLRSTFQHGQKISSKDRRIVTFSKELNLLIRYLERSPENLEARCVLIGVCFVGPYVCVNTRQLKSYLCRCKSSINGALAKMGYSTAPIKGDLSRGLVMAIPFLKGNFAEQRMWTIRRRNVASPAPVMSLGMMSSPYPGMSYIVTPQPMAPPDTTVMPASPAMRPASEATANP